jgi:hypothetical protein
MDKKQSVAFRCSCDTYKPKCANFRFSFIILLFFGLCPARDVLLEQINRKKKKTTRIQLAGRASMKREMKVSFFVGNLGWRYSLGH